MNCSTSRTAEQNEAIDWLNIHVTFLELKSHQGDTEPALKAAFYPPRCFEFTRPSTFSRPAATKLQSELPIKDWLFIPALTNRDCFVSD